MQNYFKFGPDVKDISFKDISILALAAILFSGVEPFVQF